MTTLQVVSGFLDRFAPPNLAEEWDNVGLLAGDPAAVVTRVMTCLTISPRTAGEAVERGADLVVAHHPLPFRPLRRLVTDTLAGRLLWQLLSHRVAIYSPHTAYDSSAAGINESLAMGVGLEALEPLLPAEGGPVGTGGGRRGRLPAPESLGALAERLKAFLAIRHLQYVGELTAPVQHVAVACGAAGALLPAAREAGCAAMILGEANLHTCIEAEASRLALLLPGHYASERFAVERLAEVLAAQFSDLVVWASSSESDPLRLL